MVKQLNSENSYSCIKSALADVHYLINAATRLNDIKVVCVSQQQVLHTKLFVCVLSFRNKYSFGTSPMRNPRWRQRKPHNLIHNKEYQCNLILVFILFVYFK
jgi:hypothetical protein